MRYIAVFFCLFLLKTSNAVSIFCIENNKKAIITINSEYQNLKYAKYAKYIKITSNEEKFINNCKIDSLEFIIKKNELYLYPSKHSQLQFIKQSLNLKTIKIQIQKQLKMTKKNNNLNDFINQINKEEEQANELKNSNDEEQTTQQEELIPENIIKEEKPEDGGGFFNFNKIKDVFFNNQESKDDGILSKIIELTTSDNINPIVKEIKKYTNFSTKKKERIAIIDPEGGGFDNGSVYNNFKEKEVSLDIAKNIQNVLVENGVLSYLTRNADYFVSANKKTALIKKTNASVFISIGLQKEERCKNASSSGLKIYIDSQSSDMKKLAFLFKKHLEYYNINCDIINATTNEIQSKMLHQSDMAIAVELGCVFNSNNLQKIDLYQQKVKLGLSKGLIEYFS